ncbi:MFS transporter [Conexibacter sp. SYSU D00693]|uniref:MFS transporter n=1 Tax=Conexibacter sp. SYSU D00693 TaxID=2812560 RepID=UPI00196ACA1A|nr:MFS transporter [Conexibacter sp. SYSU D00693]
MTRTQRWTLAVVCAATAMLMLDIAVVNTALSRIAEDLQTDVTGLQWVVDAYTLALATVVLTAGSLADRFGRKRLFQWGLALFTLSSIACAAATDITFLNVARAVQGVGAAVMFATSLSLLAAAFRVEERAKAFAAYGAVIGASFAFGPLIGGALTSGLDWQWVFIVNIPIGLACMAITARQVHESADPAAPKVDVPGQLALTGGLFLLVLGLLRGNEDGWGSTPILLELGGAAAFLVAFVAIEARVAQPMLPLRLFRDRDFTGAQVAAYAISASFFAVFLYTTLYLQQVLGLSAIEAGLVYMPATLLNFVVAGASAQLMEKVAPRVMISVGLGLVALGMGVSTMAAVDSSWTVLLPGMVICMIGTGMFNPALATLAVGAVPVEQSGLASGVNDTFRQAGIAVGVAALGALIPTEEVFGGGDHAAFVDGMHDALWAGSALAAVGAVAAWVLIRWTPSGAAAPAPAAVEPAAA